MRYTTAGAIVSDTDFSSATPVAGVPAPQVAGSAETFTITGLTPGTTYFFGIKTADEAGNVSGLSNSPKGITAAIPTEKYFIKKSTGDWQIVTVNTYTEPMVSLVNILGTTNPAAGRGIYFSTSTFPAGATGQELTVLSTNTNSNGLAETQLKLGNIPAEYGVTATCASCEPSSNTVTYTCCGKLPNDDFKQSSSTWASLAYDNICSTVPAGSSNFRPVYSCDAPIFNNPQYQKYKFSINAKGCGLSVMATLINHYRDAYNLPISSATPATLNKYLQDNSGYDGNGAVYFQRVYNFSDEYINYLGDKTVDKNGVTRDSLIKDINKAVFENRPVIIRVPGHFMLVRVLAKIT